MADANLIPTIDRSKYLHRPKPGFVLFRHGGKTIARMPGEEGSPEFNAAYDAALAKIKLIKVGRPKAMFKKRASVAVVNGERQYKAPMLGWVINQWLGSDYFRSEDHATERTFAPGTQKGYTYAAKVMRDDPTTVEGLDRPFGEANFKNLTPQIVDYYVEAVRKTKGAATASTHRMILKLLWKFASKSLPQLGNLRERVNPVLDTDNPYKVRQRIDEHGEKQKGHLAWPLDVQEQFKAHCSPDALLIFLLALNTGQRIGDIAKLKWSQFDGTHITIVSQKTNTKARRRAPPDLLAMLQGRKRVAVTIVTNRYRRPYKQGCIWASFKAILRKIGAPQYTTHGLRKTAAKLLADQGATVERIMVLGGWKSEKTARYYVQLASKGKIADAADDDMDAALASQAEEAARRRRAAIHVVGGEK